MIRAVTARLLLGFASGLLLLGGGGRTPLSSIRALLLPTRRRARPNRFHVALLNGLRWQCHRL